MAAEVRAADLPEGSIVAQRLHVYVKEEDSRHSLRPWISSVTSCSDAYVDEVISEGAQVLRRGYGEEQP